MKAVELFHAARRIIQIFFLPRVTEEDRSLLDGFAEGNPVGGGGFVFAQFLTSQVEILVFGLIEEFAPGLFGQREQPFITGAVIEHAHDFDMYIIFLGFDADNMGDLGAEIEMCLGEEEEKHIITSPTCVYIPKGMKHCPLNFKRVDKPILFIHCTLASEYKK